MRILYLGTNPSRYPHSGELIHYPVIRTVPRTALTEAEQHEVSQCTHWLFTSPNAVRHWFGLALLKTAQTRDVYRAHLGCVNLEGHHKGPSLNDLMPAILRQYGPPHDRSNLDPSEAPQNSQNLSGRGIFAVGESTAAALAVFGIKAHVAAVATQEGVVELLSTWDLTHAVMGWPHSSRARPVIANYLKKRGVSLMSIALYDTLSQRLEPVPDLVTFDQVVFTSPSTVDAFIEIFGQLPAREKIVSLGPITQDRLQLFMRA